MTRAGTASEMARGKSRVARAIIAALFAVAVVAGTAAPASAATLGAQATSHSGQFTWIFATFSTNSTYLSSVKIQHSAENKTVCEKQGEVWGNRILNGASTTYSKVFGYSAACGWALGEVVGSPNVYWQGGSPVYGRFFHDGAWAPGYPYVIA
ncbi:hypothetical protein [Microbacterium sp. NPDC058389]|uniref:hypothetical protein n=1 Tax=Microbacterium sp. NPDC058389 TaxID=3346475 RepID=UPI003655EFEE